MKITARLKAAAGFLRALAVLLWSALPCLPVLARVAAVGVWNDYKLRLHKTKCAVCRCDYSPPRKFIKHPELDWTCGECWGQLLSAGCALNRATLQSMGIKPEGAG